MQIVLEVVCFVNGVVYSLPTAIAKKLPSWRTRIVSINWLKWIQDSKTQKSHFRCFPSRSEHKRLGPNQDCVLNSGLFKDRNVGITLKTSTLVCFVRSLWQKHWAWYTCHCAGSLLLQKDKRKTTKNKCNRAYLWIHKHVKGRILAWVAFK